MSHLYLLVRYYNLSIDHFKLPKTSVKVTAAEINPWIPKEGHLVYCGNVTAENIKGPFPICATFQHCFKIWNGSYFQLDTIGNIFLSIELLMKNTQISQLKRLFSNYSALISYSPEGVYGMDFVFISRKRYIS